jgi:asparagine synthase (glutamine-hydrolysing)
MHHRGPDDGGSFTAPGVWLGHRRLAILDLSDAGHQPLVDPETGTVIVFNGEIFNYLELRDTLQGHGHRFHGHSDTEVLLRAYLQWGADCLRRLNGMWAFVIWDPRRRRAFFSRDRFGIKPLFMARIGDGLALASEPKALLELDPALRRPDLRAVGRLLADQQVYVDGHSFYESISVFPAAHAGHFAPGDRRAEIEPYWALPEPGEASGASATDFPERFERSVALRLRSDVPLAITLSGGLDSTAVLHAACRGLGPETPLHAYTAVYDDHGADGQWLDERVAARSAIAPYATGVLHEVGAQSDDLLSTLRRIVWHMDGPGFSPAVLPLWQIMRGVRAGGVTVVLEGQGADELLGGYAGHVAAALRDALGTAARERRPEAVAAVARSAAAVAGAFSARRVLGDLVAGWSPHAQRLDLRRRTLRDVLVADLMPASSAPPTSRGQDGPGHLERRLRADFGRELLPAFLHYGDAISMAHSIESRLPFLDHELVESCARLPARDKVRDGVTKAVLRDYLRARGHADIAGTRRKRGFPTPAGQWLARDQGAVLREVLLDPGAASAPWLRRPALERAITRLAGGHHAQADALFSLLSTELWLGECVRAPA